MFRSESIKLNQVALNFLFALALLLLGGISYLSYFELKNLVKANHLVIHTYEVIGKINMSLFVLVKMESDQRAYLITGDKVFLKELNDLTHTLYQNLNEARVLTKDNLPQKERLARYSDMIKNRLVVLNETISNKEKNNLNTAEGLALFNHGSELSSQIKDLGQEIKAVEEILLKVRNDLTVGRAKTGSILLISGGVFSFILLILPFILANIELMNRRTMEIKNNNTRTHLRQIIESTKDMIAALDLNNRFEIFNEAYQHAFERLFGKTLMIGMTMEEALAHLPKDKKQYLQLWKRSLEPNELTQILEWHQDNHVAVYELHSQAIKNEHNVIKGLVHTIRDVTNSRQEHTELQNSYKQLSAGMKELELKNKQINLLVDMSDIMLAANSQDELSQVMAKYAQSLLSFSSGYLFIMHPSKNYLEKSACWGKPHQQEDLMVSNQCWAIRLGRLHQIREANQDLVCDHIKMSSKMAGIICVPLMAQNDIYGLLYIEFNESTYVLNEDTRLIISAFSELTALSLANIRLRENLRYQSIRDTLTGLYNRRYMEDALFKQLHQAERSKFSFALLMLDVDHFKKINDNYGHDAGDLVLKEMGKILEDSIRQGDVAARYGGEEFLLLLHHVDLEQTKKRAEQIRIALSKLQIKYGAQPIIPITVSIGIAMFPQDSRNKEELIELADKALYAAKNQGRNKTLVFSELDK